MDLKGRDFLKLLDFTSEEITYLLDLAAELKDKKKKGIPVDFLAMVYEYGRSGYPFPKKPFFRKAWNKGKIEQAMLEAQKRASGGLLDE